MVTVRAREENHLTQVATKAIEASNGNTAMHRLWFRPARDTLLAAGVYLPIEPQSELLERKLQHIELVKAHLAELRRLKPCGLRLHTSFGGDTSCLLEA